MIHTLRVCFGRLNRTTQGSILTQVNVGAMHAAKVFLSKPLDFPVPFVKQLCAAMNKFLQSATLAGASCVSSCVAAVAHRPSRQWT